MVQVSPYSTRTKKIESCYHITRISKYRNAQY